MLTISHQEVRKKNTAQRGHGSRQKINITAEIVIKTDNGKDDAHNTEPNDQIRTLNLCNTAQRHGTGINAALSCGPDIEHQHQKCRRQQSLRSHNHGDIRRTGGHRADCAGKNHKGIAEHQSNNHDNDCGLGAFSETHNIRREHNRAYRVGTNTQSHRLAEADWIFLRHGHQPGNTAAALDSHYHRDCAKHDNQRHSQVAQISHPFHSTQCRQCHADTAQNRNRDNRHHGKQRIGGLPDHIRVDGKPTDCCDRHNGDGYICTCLAEGIFAQKSQCQTALCRDYSHYKSQYRQNDTTEQNSQKSVTEIQANADIAARLHTGHYKDITQ